MLRKPWLDISSFGLPICGNAARMASLMGRTQRSGLLCRAHREGDRARHFLNGRRAFPRLANKAELRQLLDRRSNIRDHRVALIERALTGIFIQSGVLAPTCFSSGRFTSKKIGW
jgi:hypothetical protein